MSRMPRYPVYVISKGRADRCLTATLLDREGTPFRLVVEPPEAPQYVAKYGVERVLVLPFANLGLGGIPARNWVWEHAKSGGHMRHWILDDNIYWVRRLYRGKKIPMRSGLAFSVVEDFVDRYSNVAVAGMNVNQLVISTSQCPPFWLNVHVYSCLLIDNAITQRWRGRYNEDTDLCLQVLADGYCTVLMNAFVVDKAHTCVMPGGNTDQLYAGDGRLRMARSLERMWPGVVRTDRRFQRPQHVVRGAWRGFDTPLRRKPEAQQAPPVDYGIRVVEVTKPRSPEIERIARETRRKD